MDINVIHKIEDDVELKLCSNPSFLLNNKQGGFISLASNKNISHYQGCYFLKKVNEINWSLFKVIEDIKINKEPTHLINNFSSIERWYGNKKDQTRETFFMQGNACLYNLENYDGDIDITLDCREINDFDDKGRIYKITNKKDHLIIEYTKYFSNKLKNESYKIYLVIKGCSNYKAIDKWEEKRYEYDKKRGSKSKLFIYNALKIKAKKNTALIFSYGDDIELAKEKADELDLDGRKNKFIEEEHMKTLTKMKGEIYDEKTKLAYKNCVNSLYRLSTQIENKYGIIAGLPWFYQFWTRDETISTTALINEEYFLDAKVILFNELNELTQNGRLPNRMPHSKLECADSIGWCFYRINELLNFTKHNYLDKQYFSKNDIEFLKEKLRESIVKQLKYFTHDGLVYNRKQETWMDTEFKDDSREGFRIEIQALRLRMYSFMKELYKMTNDKSRYLEYKKLEEETRNKVKNAFWNSPILADGINEDGSLDKTIRPNIFIAYYIYPKLLEDKKWDKCFEHALKKLWLNWGGISTIEKGNKLFCEEYSGENNKSYHRGDSWYWINSLVAICLQRHEKKMNKKSKWRLKKRKNKYKKFIDQIIEASSEEILFNGYIGHHAELSSAKELRSEGCLCQAWSSALFIELVNEVHFSYLK
jgi:hypothetical protein